MTRKMGDAWEYSLIPLAVDMVALYCNGQAAASAGVAAKRFPASKYVTIWVDIFGTAPDKAQVLDVENGAASAATAPGWIRNRRALVHTSLPTLYCNRSTLPGLKRTCSVGGLVAGRDYQLWISTLDNTQHLADGTPLNTVPGVVACQYQGGMEAPYDLSVVYDDRWHPLAKLDPKRRAEAPDRSPPRSAPGPHCFT